jgi:Uma2 family endonuclease
VGDRVVVHSRRTIETSLSALLARLSAWVERWMRSRKEYGTMGLMTSQSLGHGYTREDFDRTPERDGYRYELLEGELIVSASPAPRHQLIVTELLVLLRQACPDDLRVVPAPLDVELEETSIVEPDLIVFDPVGLDARRLMAPPLLAVEVLSPSSRSRDQVKKKRLYERTGVASYWIVDPEDDISLTAWDLCDGHYRPVAAIAGDEEWTTAAPYEVTIVPSRLLR